MKVLVTGAFGNVGVSTAMALLERGHAVRCFDVPTKANRKQARRFGPQVESVWGDLRSPEALQGAVAGQEVVIHLAFVIPKLSVTGVDSEDAPEFAESVNVGGTRNLLAAIAAQPTPPRLIFTSSVHVYGQTQDCPPPRTIHDPVRPIEHYSQHKVTCEALVRASASPWAILRLGATLPLAMKLDPGMFDVPLDNRMEYVHTRDVGVALANAVDCPDVWGKLLLIGGGPACQYMYREIAAMILEGMGVGMLPEAAFGKRPFCTDWMDTTESQALLHYQSRTLDDYVADMQALLGFRLRWIRASRPLIRDWLLRQSPYYHRAGLKPAQEPAI